MQKFITLWFFILGLSSCAYMSQNGSRQAIPVRSYPSGAKILEKGKEIGTTPDYVRVGRAANPLLALSYGEQTKQLKVGTKYRWVDSFWSNWIFFAYAPVGWAVDLITGSAWDLDDPAVFKFSDSPGQGKASEKVIAIAPPTGETVEIGDAVGEMLEEQLRASDLGVIKDYRKTSPIFEYYDFASSNQSRLDKNEMYYNLDASHIYSSRLIPSSEGFVVKGKLIDVYTGERTKLNDLKVVAGTDSAKSEVNQRKSLGDLFHFLPNTFFVNLQSDNMSVDVNYFSYEAKHPKTDRFEDKIFRYIGSINLAHMNRPRKEVIGRWYTQFVPSLILSKDDFVFEEYAPLSTVAFERWYAGAGYGVEFGYLSNYGYVYLNLIPNAIWSRISYVSSGSEQTFQEVNTVINSEIGYTYFWSDHLVTKLFVKNRTENMALWKQAMSSASQQDTLVTYAGSGVAGIAIGYYLPDSLRGRKDWLVRKR